MDTPELKITIYGIEGEGQWFRLYECEHITNGSYPLETCIPIGQHTNLAMCRHCWEGIRGEVSKEFVKEIFQVPTNYTLLKQMIEEGSIDSTDVLQAARIRDLMQGRSPKVEPGILQSQEERDNIAPVTSNQSVSRADTVESGTIQNAP